MQEGRLRIECTAPPFRLKACYKEISAVRDCVSHTSDTSRYVALAVAFRVIGSESVMTDMFVVVWGWDRASLTALHPHTQKKRNNNIQTTQAEKTYGPTTGEEKKLYSS